ncbi:MAG: methyl-accepting chemotaxis protein [Solidesulfovibrio sp. DCME]|uniref:methyl-accepting chemotaxis protein n=1 Tax=Solidesulfovibrio sp. DCME TaxID=3447380 RepID=UPI003D0A9C74
MKNISIQWRLLGGFCLVTLMTAVLGVSSFRGFGDITDSVGKVSGTILPSVEALADIRYNLMVIFGLQKVLLFKDVPDRAKLYADIDAARKRYMDAVGKYEKLPKNEAAIKPWNDFTRLIEKARDENRKTLSFLKDWEQDNSREDYYRQALSSALTGASDVTIHEAMEALGRVIQINVDDSAREGAAAARDAAANIRLAGIVLGLAVVLSLVLGVCITRSIVGPLKLGVDFAVAVSEGRLDETLRLRQGDEVGRLADRLRAMVATLKDKVLEAESKERQAAAEAQKAALATREAEQARGQAETARQEGILHVARQLGDIVERLSCASEELSAQIEQSSQGTSTQRKRVEETATSMEQMSASVMEVAKNATLASNVSSAAKDSALKGKEVVAQVVSAIGSVQRQAEALTATMGDLGERAEGIGRIITVISDIADQTNLLALNAAIEAARAGDAGRGFAVVADEVRKLAEKTMAATRDVGEAVRGIQHGTRETVANARASATDIQHAASLSQDSDQALDAIVAMVDQAFGQVQSIATAAEQQSRAGEEINQAVSQINKIALENSQAMEQSSQAVIDLAKQAQMLHAVIEDMRAAA